MRQIDIIRHAETAANAEGVFRGRNNVGLSDNGVQQAREVAGLYRETALDYVFSAPVRRAMQTAQLAFPSHKIISEELINNLDFGKWAGRPKKEVKEQEPENWHLWVTTPEKLRFPEGESLGDVYKRVTEFLEKLARLEFERLVVVSNRSVIKVLLAAVAGVTENYYWRFHMDNGSVTTLIHDPARGFTITKLNYTEHLTRYVFEWN